MRTMQRVFRPLLQFQLRPSRPVGGALLRHRPPAFSTNAKHSNGGGDDQHVLESDYPAVPLPNAEMSQFLIDSNSRHTSRTALVDGVTGRRVTYGALIDGLKRWAAVVQKRTRAGAATPPTVAIFMRNSPDYSMFTLGTVSVGAMVTTINSNYSVGEVARQLEDSGAQLLVVEDRLEVTALKAIQLLQQQMREAGKEAPFIEMFVCGGGSSAGHSDIRGLLADKTAPFATPVTVDPESVAVLLYSSGTTGLPKGVCIKHSAMTNSVKMLIRDVFLLPRDEDDPDILLGLMPFYHIYGILTFNFIFCYWGSTIVTLPSFQQDTFINAIRKYKPSILPMVPTLIKYIIECEDIRSEDLKSCHTVSCGGAPVSEATVQNLQKKTGGKVHFSEGYGLTEMMMVSASPRKESLLGYCGKLLPNTKAKIVHPDTGAALPIGQRGEILVKSPLMMAGYLNNPAATKEIINEDGWLHTGDVGIFHQNGHFSIVDRIKDLIKVNAYQVSPTELEAVMLKHPSIADVGVVGMPHDRFGEVPRAYIIRRAGKNITEEEVNQHMMVHLSKHKQLVGGIKFVDDLPKNATGKLSRRTLKEMALEEL